jgi:hypothetical protein
LELLAIVEFDGSDYPIYEPDETFVTAADLVFDSVRETVQEMVRCGETIPPHLRGEIFHSALVDAVQRMCPNLPIDVLQRRSIHELEGIADTVRRAMNIASH